MNYDRIYQELMAVARRRGADKSKLDGYYERHHILPTCLGGSNDEANLVLLTAREHFVAHRLLAKAHPDNNKLLFAVANFQRDKGFRLLTSYQVATARKANAVAVRLHSQQLVASGLHHWQTADHRKAATARAALRNAEQVSNGSHHWQADKFRETQSQLMKQLAAEGKHPAQTAKYREALSQRSSQRQAQLAAEGKHPFQTAELRAAASERMAKKVTCPYCGKIGGATIMPRWHFENCRHKAAH